MAEQNQEKKQEKRNNGKKRRSFRQWAEEFRWNRKNVTLTVIVIVLIAALAIFIVTRVRSQNSNIITDNGVAYKLDDTVNLSMTSVKSTNPVNSTDEDTYYISKLVYSSLFSLGSGMTPQEDLVSSYDFDRSGRKLTLTLRNAKWQDGKDVTASDVKFSIEAYKAASKNSYKEMVDPIYSVSTDGSDKVTIYYKTGARMKVSDLVFPILPEHKYNGVYDVIYRKKIRMIGSGPYKAGKYNDSSGMKLTANDDYYGEKAENNINISILSAKADKNQMTYSGSISCALSRSITREAAVSADEVKIKDFPANKVDYIGFNFLREKMTDKNIRKAIASAIDNRSIIQEVYYNSAMLNDNMFYPGYLGEKSSGDAYPHSEAASEKYLDKAGYKDRDDDGYVEDKDNAELSVTFLYESSKRNRQTADKIKDDLEDAGIRATLVPAEGKTYDSYLKGTNFDIFMGEFHFNESMDFSQILKGTPKTTKYVYDSGSSSGSQDSSSDQDTSDSDASSGSQDDNSGKYGEDTSGTGSGSYGSGNSSGSTRQRSSSNLKKEESYSREITGSNYTRYYSSRVNSLLERMDSGLSNEEMKKAFVSMKKKLNSDLPYYCLFYRTDGMIKSPSLQGSVKPVFWNIYSGCGSWKTRIEMEEDKK